MDSRSIDERLQESDALARRGKFGEATATLNGILAEYPDHVQTLTMVSRIYRADGQFKKAIASLEKLSEINPSDPWVWYDLGAVYEDQQNLELSATAYIKAWSLDQKNARFALNAGFALWQDGKTEDALNVWSLGSDIDPLVRTAQFRPEADASTRMKSNTADTELRRHLSQLFSDGLKAYDNPERLTTAMWPQTHFGNVDYKIENQKPYMFYAPDLPALPVFDVSKLSWAETLKEATADIKTELNTYLNRTQDYGKPYLSHVSDGEESWRDLRGSADWNALHLYKDAKKQSCASVFPKTMTALENVPMVELFGAPMEIFFSVLKPGTHIPPHFGLSNARLTAHLPLIIPSDCEIRVSDHVHHWREGELFLFDDSFDHEARNDSDEIRIVLIFETWRPDLSQNEIDALQHAMEARNLWLNNRKIPNFESN